MRCRTCMYYCAKPRADSEGILGALSETRHHSVPWADAVQDTTLPSEGLGRCRRHAPTMSGFPVVWPSDWCGDHKLDEEKL
jgi:hypothetical protein